MKDDDGIRHHLAAFDFEDENSPAWRRGVLEILEREGRLIKTGKVKTDFDGVTCPVYAIVDNTRDFKNDFGSAEMQLAFDTLERKALIRKTGEYRRTGDGPLSPCYVVVGYEREH